MTRPLAGFTFKLKEKESNVQNKIFEEHFIDKSDISTPDKKQFTKISSRRRNKKKIINKQSLEAKITKIYHEENNDEKEDLNSNIKESLPEISIQKSFNDKKSNTSINTQKGKKISINLPSVPRFKSGNNCKPLFNFKFKPKKTKISGKSIISPKKQKNNQALEESIRCDDIDSKFFVDSTFKELEFKNFPIKDHSAILQNIKEMKKSVLFNNINNKIDKSKLEIINKDGKKLNILKEEVHSKEKSIEIMKENIVNKQFNPESQLKKSRKSICNTSPLNYYMLIDENLSTESKINELLKMSMNFLSDKEQSFRDIEIKIDLKDNSDQQLFAIEQDIEKIKEEMVKWEQIGNEYENDCLKLGDILNTWKEQGCHKEEIEQIDQIDHFEEEVLEQHRIERLSSMLQKYVNFVGGECEEVYRKMFALVKTKRIDPMLILKKLAGMKKYDFSTSN